MSLFWWHLVGHELPPSVAFRADSGRLLRFPVLYIPLLLVPLLVGFFFGVGEHYLMYPSECALSFVARVLGHPGFTLTALGVCLLVWRKRDRAAIGLSAGDLAGMLPHAFFNFGAVAPWPLAHTVVYRLPVSIVSFAVGLALLREVLRREPASDPSWLLATGK